MNQNGYGICSKAMMLFYPLMEAVRSGGFLRNMGGSERYEKDIVYSDGCVTFRLSAKKLKGENLFIAKASLISGSKIIHLN